MTKSGTGTWDLGTRDPGTWDPRTWDPRTWDPGPGNVGLGVIYYNKLTLSYQDLLQFHCSHSHFSSFFLQCYQAK